MNRPRSLALRYGVDVLVVVGGLAAGVGALLREDPPAAAGTVQLWSEAVGVALVVLVLLLRRRLPFAAPAFTFLLAASLSFVDGDLVVNQATVFLAGMGAALLLGYVRNDRQARVGLALVLVCAASVVYNAPHSTADFFFTPMLFGTGWLTGFALRGRTERTEAAEQRAALAEREREVAARIAVAEERSRIARELHDVVAHAVSVMVLQVGAVRHKMPDSQAEDREALKNVEDAGRAALAEMRRLLGAMRRDGEAAELQPQPGLGNVDALLSDVRAAGLDVELQVHGEPTALPPALDLSAYRILQEGLTNALKHSKADHAEVDVTYGERDLVVAVRDNGRGPAASDGLGHGLVGVGERVKIYGGEMTAGSENGHGFTLRVRLPLQEAGR